MSGKVKKYENLQVKTHLDLLGEGISASNRESSLFGSFNATGWFSNSCYFTNNFEVDGPQHVFLPSCVVATMLSIADRLTVPHACKYMAFELFERFIVRQAIQQRGSAPRPRRSCTERAIGARIERQLPLVALACFTLSAKNTDHYRLVFPTNALKMLEEVGERHTTDDLLGAELLVARTLQHELYVRTVHEYVCLCLEQLRMESGSPLAQPEVVKASRDQCGRVLDIFYLWRDEIYAQLLERLATNAEQPSSSRVGGAFREVVAAADAGAVASAASWPAWRSLLERQPELAPEWHAMLSDRWQAAAAVVVAALGSISAPAALHALNLLAVSPGVRLQTQHVELLASCILKASRTH